MKNVGALVLLAAVASNVAAAPASHMGVAVAGRDVVAATTNVTGSATNTVETTTDGWFNDMIPKIAAYLGLHAARDLQAVQHTKRTAFPRDVAVNGTDVSLDQDGIVSTIIKFASPLLGLGAYGTKPTNQGGPK